MEALSSANILFSAAKGIFLESRIKLISIHGGSMIILNK